MRLNLTFCYSHSQKAEQLKVEEIKISGVRDSGQTLHFGSNLAWTSPLQVGFTISQSATGEEWDHFATFPPDPTKNTEMLQLGLAEFHKDIEKLSEEAQLIWNLSKFGCVVNVFGSFWGIEINTGARWWQPSCVSLGWKSGTICYLVCVCFWKTAHRSVKTKKCSHWNYYAKACSANWGFF